MRQKFVQRRIERADCDRIAIHCFEYAEKIFALEGFYLLQRELSLFWCGKILFLNQALNLSDPVFQIFLGLALRVGHLRWK